jgi:DNA-binding PadR family transcriptional regulator
VAEVNATGAALLGFLHRRPMTGWQIAQAAETELCDYWNLNRSHVYRELAKLTEAGLVEAGAKGVREQVPYTITAEGKEAFLVWLRQDPGPEIMRSPLHLKLAFADHLDDATCARFVGIYRRRNEERLEYYRQVERDIGEAMPNLTHVLRSGIAMREALLRWLDSLPWTDHTRLTHGDDQP